MNTTQKLLILGALAAGGVGIALALAPKKVTAPTPGPQAAPGFDLSPIASAITNLFGGGAKPSVPTPSTPIIPNFQLQPTPFIASAAADPPSLQLTAPGQLSAPVGVRTNFSLTGLVGGTYIRAPRRR